MMLEPRLGRNTKQSKQNTTRDQGSDDRRKKTPVCIANWGAAVPLALTKVRVTNTTELNV
jgi:hypothetical protein